MKTTYQCLYLLALILLYMACNMDPFQPGRPIRDGGMGDSDATENDDASTDGNTNQ